MKKDSSRAKLKLKKALNVESVNPILNIFVLLRVLCTQSRKRVSAILPSLHLQIHATHRRFLLNQVPSITRKLILHSSPTIPSFFFFVASHKH
jgi:hypothetical protein